MFAPSSSPSLRRGTGALALAVAVLPIAVLGACGSSSKSSKAASTTTTATGAATTAGGPETTTLDGRQVVVRGRQSVTGTAAIEIDDNYYTPNLLTATPGSTVTINLQSKAAGIHNLSVPGQSVDVDVPAGMSASAKVTVPANGQLIFYCKFHRDESGMVGAFNAA